MTQKSKFRCDQLSYMRDYDHESMELKQFFQLKSSLECQFTGQLREELGKESIPSFNLREIMVLLTNSAYRGTNTYDEFLLKFRKAIQTQIYQRHYPQQVR